MKPFEFTLKAELNDDGSLPDELQVSGDFKGSSDSLYQILFHVAERNEVIKNAVMAAGVGLISTLPEERRNEVAIGIIKNKIEEN